jgi:hypothetical protein
LDGNYSNQTLTHMAGYAWIRVSCISAAYVFNVNVNACVLKNAKNTAFAVSYYSDGINLLNCKLSNSVLLGISVNDSGTTNILNCYLEGSLYGIKLTNPYDLSIDNCTFSTIPYAIDIVEAATRVKITSNSFVASYSRAIGISGPADGSSGTHAKSISIIGNNFELTNNAIYLSNCDHSVIASNTIRGYGSVPIGILVSSAATDPTTSTCSYLSINNNEIFDCDVGFRNDSLNTYSNGATNNFFTNNNLSDCVLNTDGDFTGWTLFCLQTNSNGGVDDLLTTDGAGNIEFVSRSEAGPIYSGSDGIDVSGTFPNFTITNLIGIEAGDRIEVTGTYPNHIITAKVPAFNQALITAAEDVWSTTYVATPYEITITPRSNTSRVKITITNGTVRSTTGTAYLTIFRDNSLNLAGTVGLTDSLASVTPLAFAMPVSMCIVDHPNTNVPVTYTLYMCCGSGHVYFNEGNTVAVIAEEIFV